MKLCKKCGKLMGYNSYFGGYYCTSCGKLGVERKSTITIVRKQLKRKEVIPSKVVVYSET